MKITLASSRVITREICRQGLAHDKAVWKGSDRIKIYACDPAYGGRDRCIIGWVEFGEGLDGGTILKIQPPRLLRISLKDGRIPEDQIAEAVKQDMEDHGIPAQNGFYDSFGKGTVGNAFAKVFGNICPVPINAGEPPTQRPVRHDLYVVEPGGRQRLKRCDEHYFNFITEMWFSAREAIEAGQVRELPEDVMMEGCSRQYITVSGYKIQVEPKHDMRKRTGKSPDLFDWLCIAIEGARRMGFHIRGLGAQNRQTKADTWMDKERDKFREMISSKMLRHPEGRESSGMLKFAA
jgi:hypothetical protein